MLCVLPFPSERSALGVVAEVIRAHAVRSGRARSLANNTSMQAIWPRCPAPTSGVDNKTLVRTLLIAQEIAARRSHSRCVFALPPPDQLLKKAFSAPCFSSLRARQLDLKGKCSNSCVAIKIRWFSGCRMGI